jgi:hypothetical protein
MSISATRGAPFVPSLASLNGCLCYFLAMWGSRRLNRSSALSSQGNAITRSLATIGALNCARAGVADSASSAAVFTSGACGFALPPQGSLATYYWVQSTVRFAAEGSARSSTTQPVAGSQAASGIHRQSGPDL